MECVGGCYRLTNLCLQLMRSALALVANCTKTSTQIHQDVIRDLLAPSLASSRSSTPRGGGGGGTFSTPGAFGSSTANSPLPRLITYRDPDPTKDILLVGLEEVKVSDRQQLLQCLLDGLRARRTAATNLNAHSSRSHAVFTIRVRQTTRRLNDGLLTRPGTPRLQSGDQSKTSGSSPVTSTGGIADYMEETLDAKLHLVDLAGSERIGKSGVAGARLLEACSINQGLLALGNVIDALSDKRK